MQLIRRFDGHSSFIIDLCFSYDAQRLLVLSNDSQLRVWDLASGTCRDWVQFDDPVTSISVSVNNEFLCASVANDTFVNVYRDKSFYLPIETLLNTKSLTAPYHVDNPKSIVDDLNLVPSLQTLSSSQESGSRGVEKLDEEGQIYSEGIDFHDYIVEGKAGAVTSAHKILSLSTLPISYFETLVNLEVLKQRNTPTIDVVKPKNAPFLLPRLKVSIVVSLLCILLTSISKLLMQMERSSYWTWQLRTK